MKQLLARHSSDVSSGKPILCPLLQVRRIVSVVLSQGACRGAVVCNCWSVWCHLACQTIDDSDITSATSGSDVTHTAQLLTRLIVEFLIL